MDDTDKAIDDAFRKLGHSSVKQEQREAVRCVLLGRDRFVTVPTGFGKSAIFHALPLCASTMLKWFCDIIRSCLPCVIVISPLVSLMTDQVSKLRSMGISLARHTPQSQGKRGLVTLHTASCSRGMQ